jgi:hypothetical protein
MEILQQIWPLAAWLLGLTVGGVWWAATVNQRVKELDEKAKASSSHSGEIMLIKQTLENLTEKVGQLIDELRSTPHRTRK